MKALAAIRALSLDPGWTVGALAVVPVSLAIVMINFTDGELATAFSTILLFLLLLSIWKLPLRYPAIALIFLCLMLECPAEKVACGLYESPLYPLGEIFLQNLNTKFGIAKLAFSGLDLTFGLLVLTILWRRAHGLRIDRAGQTQTATPLGPLAILALLAVLGSWVWGLTHGGQFKPSLWQIQKILYVPAMFFLLQAVLRGPEDADAIRWAVIAAALFKAVRGIYVQLFVFTKLLEHSGGELPYVTAHSDSMLFAWASVMVFARLAEKTDTKRVLTCFLVLPLIFWVMIANNRRIVWVSLTFSLILIYSLSPGTKLKRAVGRGFILSLPLLILYMAAGWHSTAGVFAPVKTVRSIVESDSDSSTKWRDGENYNLLFTWRLRPVLGHGFGKEYVEAQPLPDISNLYPMYRYNPHNSLLGLLAFMGILSLSIWWLSLAATVFFAARSYRLLSRWQDRSTALWCICGVIVCMNQLYGDIGVSSWTTVFILGSSMAMAGKLAVASGAWPVSMRRAGVSNPRAQPAPVLQLPQPQATS